MKRDGSNNKKMLRMAVNQQRTTQKVSGDDSAGGEGRMRVSEMSIKKERRQ
jgi:hypothetical protein